MTSHDMCALCKSLKVLQDLRSSRNLCVQAWWLVGREGLCVWLQKCNPSERYESYENSRRKVGARSFYILDRFEQRQTYSSGNTRRTEAIASKCIKYIQISTIHNNTMSVQISALRRSRRGVNAGPIAPGCWWSHRNNWKRAGIKGALVHFVPVRYSLQSGPNVHVTTLYQIHGGCSLCVCWDWMCKLQVFHCL